MALCKWNTTKRGAVCESCGYSLKRNYDRPPIRECPVQCMYLGCSVGQSVLIDCRECGKRKIREFPIYLCGVYGECLPTYSGERRLSTAGDELPQKCHGCKERTTAEQKDAD